MKRYANLSGEAGVVAYEIGRDFIRVRFVDGPAYLYTVASVGRRHLQTMKRLAESGAGLTTYISRHVHDAWESKDG